ncbi:MAG: hypothetical protein IJB28_05595 [Bacteroidaceae bacterium]|nr:hypothetical protein [Bacteroidaceae bacterium]
MKKKISTLIALALLTTPAMAQQEMTREVFLEPNEVIIESSNDSMSVTIHGRQGEPNFHYNHTVVLAQDEVTVTRERRTDIIEFNIPFSKKKKKEHNTRRPHSKATMRGFGVGFVDALDTPDGMNVDMGASYELMAPSIFEWAWYPGRSSFNVSIGVGLNWKNYRMTDRNRFIPEGNDIVIGPYPEGAAIEFSRLKVFSWMVPMLMSYEFNDWLELRLGPVVNINTHASLKTRYSLDGEGKKETHNLQHYNRLTVDLMGAVCIKGLGFYVKYSPCEVLDTDYAPSFKGISTGLILGF